MSEFNPFKWAMENQFYFFHDASQFCTDRPFCIICPYDSKTAKYFTGGINDSTFSAFRSLCRRIFIGMPDNVETAEFDKKCLPIISLKHASKCISAIIFLDISMISNDDNIMVFINPNAKNKIPQSVINKFRYNMQGVVEDFEYDVY